MISGWSILLALWTPAIVPTLSSSHKFRVRGDNTELTVESFSVGMTAERKLSQQPRQKRQSLVWVGLPERRWFHIVWQVLLWLLRWDKGWTGGSRSTRSGPLWPVCWSCAVCVWWETNRWKVLEFSDLNAIWSQVIMTSLFLYSHTYRSKWQNFLKGIHHSFE